MLFGICTSISNAPAVKSAGWDYIEDNVQNLLQGMVGDAEWKAPEKAVLPVLAANVLLPGTLKVVGPHVDNAVLQKYMTTVLTRAHQVGIEKIVFGSGVARSIPAGFEHETASKQIVEFGKMIADLAAERQIQIILEPLNKSECNIVNSVAEGMRYVKAVDKPAFACLVDSYHFWLEDEPLENLRRAMPFIKHVHLADKDGRVAPGLSGKSDYRPFFRVLKNGGYDAAMSFEGTSIADFETTAPKVLDFIKQQWSEA